MAPVKEKSVRDGLNQKDQLELDAIASILGKKGDEELTRSAMDKLILDKVGHHVSDSIMAEIFQECDTDNSGTVSVDEFGNYIRNLKGSTTRGEKVRYVVCKLTFSMDWWAFIMFLIALLTSVTLNVYSRLGILPRDFNFYGMNALLYVFGCYAYVARIYDRISKDYDLIEIVNGKIITWVESLDEESGVVSSKELTPHQLFTLLEKKDCMFLMIPSIKCSAGSTKTKVGH